MTRTTNEKRMLRYNFTPEEHLANCAELARLMDAQYELKANHKSIKAQLKEDEEAGSASIGRQVRCVRDQYDNRSTECHWQYDHPTPGKKTLVRNDDGSVVEQRGMEEWEKQESLDLQAVADAQKEPGDPTAENAATETVEVPALNGGKPGEVKIPKQSAKRK